MTTKLVRGLYKVWEASKKPSEDRPIASRVMLSILYGHYPPLGSGGGPGALVPFVLQMWGTDSTVQDHQFGYLVHQRQMLGALLVASSCSA